MDYKRTSIREYIDTGNLEKSKDRIDTVQIYDSLTREDILDYMRNVYNHTIEITANERDIARCTHDFFDENGLCRTCKKSMSDILEEEVLFNIFIKKKLSKDKVVIIRNVLNDKTLSIRFETYLEKNTK